MKHVRKGEVFIKIGTTNKPKLTNQKKDSRYFWNTIKWVWKMWHSQGTLMARETGATANMLLNVFVRTDDILRKMRRGKGSKIDYNNNKQEVVESHKHPRPKVTWYMKEECESIA